MSESEDYMTGHIYAVAYDNGMLKFGMSARSPDKRIASHDAMMSLVGARQMGKYISPMVSFPFRTESKVAAKFRRNVVHGREWIQGVDLSEVAKVIKDSLIPLNDEERLRAAERRRDLVPKLIKAFSDERKRNVSSRAKMALDFGSVIEFTASVHGHLKSMMTPFDGNEDVTTLLAMATVFANEHTAEDMARLLRAVVRRPDEAEEMLLEAWSLFNFKCNMNAALNRYEEMSA